jgi:hypothetical protein
MGARTYNLDPELLYPFEIGALLLAILAWPGEAEIEAQQRGAVALAAQTLMATCDAYPREADDWRAAFPEYAAITSNEARARLRTLRRRLDDRMVAARMGLGFMPESLSKRPLILPAGMTRLSLSQLSRLVQSDRPTISDPKMIERRVWGESRPVIHLAIAMQVWCRSIGVEVTDVGYPLGDGKLHAAIIALAGGYEPIVLADRRFGVRADRLVRLRQPLLRAAA